MKNNDVLMMYGSANEGDDEEATQGERDVVFTENVEDLLDKVIDE